EPDPAGRRGGRVLAGGPSPRRDRSAVPPRRERGARAAGRVREAGRGDGLAAARLVGGGDPADDRLVRAEPRALDRPGRLARPQAGPDGMRALVTGGSGFLGSHVVERLEAAGHEAIVPRSAEFDLTHEQDAARLFARAEPELVIHLAALAGGIGANRAQPGRFWYANLAMGANVVEQSRLASVRKLVVLGTICAYPKFTPVPFHEEELWNGYPEETNAPYGIAKKALLVGAQAYREQYGLNAIYLLPVNLYGPRDNFDLQTSHVIPALIRKMLESRDRVVLWGDGSPTREFLYVEDCAAAIVLAAERYDGPEPVNLGSGEEISIRDLAGLIAELTGFEGEIEWDESQPNGQPRRLLDTRRALELFGFRAGTRLRDGLERTIAWYRANAPAPVA